MSIPTPAATPAFDCPGNYVAPAPTTLRCAKCSRPLMVKDAKRTPTGYVCPYYVKARVATFYNAGWIDYLPVIVIALIGGVIAGIVMRAVGGFILFAPVVGGAVGAGVAEVIRRVMKGKRGQNFWLVAAISLVLGAGMVILGPLLAVLALAGADGGRLQYGAGSLIGSVMPLIGLAIAVGALITRMRI